MSASFCFDPTHPNFWARYGPGYQCSAQVIRPQRGMLQLVASQLQAEAGDVVLDLGCGPGTSSAALMEQHPDITLLGCDFSEEMVTLATAYVPNARFQQHDLHNGVPANIQPKHIVSVNALYVLSEPMVRLTEWVSALPTGGTLSLVTTSRELNVGKILKTHCASTKSDAYWLRWVESDELAERLVREALVGEDEATIEHIIFVVQANRRIVSQQTFTHFDQDTLTQALTCLDMDIDHVQTTYADQCVYLRATRRG